MSEIEAVLREEHVELGGGLFQQRAVAEARPLHLRDSPGVVPDDLLREWPGQRLIEQDAHENGLAAAGERER